MKLRDLEGTFLRLLPDGPPGSSEEIGAERRDAHGVMFQCPKCVKDGCGHYVICWFTGVDSAIAPKPGRWNPSGSTLDDLTFVPPGAVSVKLNAGCGWHGLVKDGDATLST